MRVAGVDLGEKRIGVALSDATGTLASPYALIERRGDAAADRAALVEMVSDCGAVRVVIGLPVALSGSLGPSAKVAKEEARELARILEPRGVMVETFDERFTTVSAQRALRESGRKGKDLRRLVDQSAAAVMLQAWLDVHRGELDA